MKFTWNILYAFVVMIGIFVSTVLMKRKEVTHFPWLAILQRFLVFRIVVQKITVFDVLFATFTFMKMGLTPVHDLSTLCAECILTLKMTISCRLQNKLLGKKPEKKIQSLT